MSDFGSAENQSCGAQGSVAQAVIPDESSFRIAQVRQPSMDKVHRRHCVGRHHLAQEPEHRGPRDRPWYAARRAPAAASTVAFTAGPSRRSSLHRLYSPSRRGQFGHKRLGLVAVAIVGEHDSRAGQCSADRGTDAAAAARVPWGRGSWPVQS